MSDAGLGLDFLGTKAWAARIVPAKRIERPQAIQANLPTALLPLQRGEKPPTGKLADVHRRGRALACASLSARSSRCSARVRRNGAS